MKSIRDSLFYIFLYLLPKNLVSNFLGKLVSLHFGKWFSCRVNKIFAQIFKIDLKEAEKPLEQYVSLQEFFTRRLKPGVRPISADSKAIISPCDGFMSIAQKLSDRTLIQAKGKSYGVRELLGHDGFSEKFIGGHYATIYLSPRDYHRFHVPMDGEILRTVYVPGALWPVNKWAVTHVDDLFCRNERVITFVTHKETNRTLAHVAVGATLVGKIELDYCDLYRFPIDRSQQCIEISQEPVAVEKGQELGKFMFGSTIVLLCERGLINDFAKEAPTCVKMGETLGNVA